MMAHRILERGIFLMGTGCGESITGQWLCEMYFKVEHMAAWKSSLQRENISCQLWVVHIWPIMSNIRREVVQQN